MSTYLLDEREDVVIKAEVDGVRFLWNDESDISTSCISVMKGGMRFTMRYVMRWEVVDHSILISCKNLNSN